MIKKKEIEANYNEDKMKLLVSEVKQKLANIYLGGGKNKVEKSKIKRNSSQSKEITSSTYPSLSYADFSS